jgi:hypothetical protein
MDDGGGPNLLKQLLDDRLAGAAEFVDAAVDGPFAQLKPQPVLEKLRDLGPGLVMAQRQRGDKGRQLSVITQFDVL